MVRNGKIIYMKLRKNTITFVILVFIIFLGCSVILIFNKLNLSSRSVNTKEDKVTIDDSIVSCTRTTRLENKPVYDRALSFIGEKYSLWDVEYLSGQYSYSYFPSKLVNCIKVEESNLKNTTGEEGYFLFNGEQIKENYYPIMVDMDYSYNDEAINALLLVHELTHVQQYVDSLNGKPEISCIDKEVEAFHSQWNFYKFQFPEIQKTIDLRIQNDRNLNPTLQVLKTIQEQVSTNFDKRRSDCLDSSGKTDVGRCIDEFDKKLIKDLLLQDESYKKQCNL